MDIDKIISAWEHCTSDEGDCDDCPYNNDFNGCMLNLKLDTIKVLMEILIIILLMIHIKKDGKIYN